MRDLGVLSDLLNRIFGRDAEKDGPEPFESGQPPMVIVDRGYGK